MLPSSFGNSIGALSERKIKLSECLTQLDFILKKEGVGLKMAETIQLFSSRSGLTEIELKAILKIFFANGFDFNDFIEGQSNWTYGFVFVRDAHLELVSEYMEKLDMDKYATGDLGLISFLITRYATGASRDGGNNSFNEIFEKMIDNIFTKSSAEAFIGRIYFYMSRGDGASAAAANLHNFGLTLDSYKKLLENNIDFIAANEMMEFLPDSIKDVFIF